MYCAALCASLALLAGSGNNVSWLERAADCNNVRENVARLIHLPSFDLSFPPPSRLLRGSLAYVFGGLLILMQYVKICNLSPALYAQIKISTLHDRALRMREGRPLISKAPPIPRE